LSLLWRSRHADPDASSRTNYGSRCRDANESATESTRARPDCATTQRSIAHRCSAAGKQKVRDYENS